MLAGEEWKHMGQGREEGRGRCALSALSGKKAQPEASKVARGLEAMLAGEE